MRHLQERGMRGLGLMVAVGLGLVAPLIGGCHNACQDICVRMAQYAEEDCKLPVSDAEVDECLARQSDVAEREDLRACRDFGDLDVIRSQWSCDDLGVYFGDDGADEAR